MPQQGDSEGKQRGVWVTWLGVLGAILVMVVALYSTFNRSVPETMLLAPTTLTFSGPDLQKEPPEPIVVSLHNFIVLCSRPDLDSAAAYIDPQSALAGHPEAACGAVAGVLQHSVQTEYQFEHFAVVDNEASVYVAIRTQQSAREHYIYNMRRVKGKWYFTVP